MCRADILPGQASEAPGVSSSQAVICQAAGWPF